MPEEILIGFDELAEVGFDVDKVLARAYDATEGEQYEILHDYLYEWDAERPVDWREDPEAVRADDVVHRVLTALNSAWDRARRRNPNAVPMRVNWLTRFRHRDGRGLVGYDWDGREVDLRCHGGDAYGARAYSAGAWDGFCRVCGKFVDVQVADLLKGTRVRFAPGYHHAVHNEALYIGHLRGFIVQFERDMVSVTLDTHRHLLDEWDNRLIFTGDTFPELTQVPYSDVRPPFMQLLDTVGR